MDWYSMENGNWAPHLHFQIILDLIGFQNDFPGVAYHKQIRTWQSLCPDPNLLFKSANLGVLKRPIQNPLSKIVKHIWEEE